MDENDLAWDVRSLRMFCLSSRVYGQLGGA